jgi:hypothetical protein
MADDVLVDDSAAQDALEKYAMTPYPGTQSICPEAVTILDQLIGTSMNRIMIEAEADEDRTGEELSRVAVRLKMAGDAFLELMGPVLEGHVVRAQTTPAKVTDSELTNVQGYTFNEQDRIDIDIAFSVARDAMRALGWNETAIEDFTDLQYRLRVMAGLQ